MAIITWRNINQPVASGAGVLMHGAQQGVNNGFNVLQNVLAQRNKTEQENWQTQKANNTSDYLDAVQGVSDPSQLQDPTVQANLANLKQQFGYQVDANAIRGAVDERANTLRVNATNQIKFDDMKRVDTERDAVDRISGLYQAGKYAEGDALRQGQNFRDDAALDALRVSSQRGYSQENRAEAADGRAAASHGLNMQVGRENLNWTRGERSRLTEERQRLSQADDLVSNTILGWSQSKADEAAKTNELAASMGIPVVNGVPDLSALPPSDASVFADELKKAGLGGLPSATAIEKKLEAELRANPAYMEQDITAAVQNLRAGLTNTQSISEVDQKDVTERLGALDSVVKRNTERQNTAFAKEQKKNIFLQGIEDPAMTVEDVAASFKTNEFDPMFAEGTNRDDVIESAVNIMTKGLEVDGQVYEIPPPMMKAAMAMGMNDWFNPSQGIEDSLAAFIKANKEEYAASIGALDNHKAELQSINEEGLRRAARIDAEAKASNGVPFDVNKLLKKLNQERN